MNRLAPSVVDALTTAGLDPVEVQRVVLDALHEDLMLGPDVTTEATVPTGTTGTADVVARAYGRVAGIPVALAVLDMGSASLLSAGVHRTDGDCVSPGDTILRVTGPLRSLLTCERTMLNLLTHLSGVATLTRSWVDQVAGTGAVIRDTRKTLPGLRHLQKYAVRCGGGSNHRMALGDAALIKDNHVAAAGGITAAIHAVRAHAADIDLEVECDTIDQVREAVTARATLILLDNMSITEMRAAVALARSVPGLRLEASGGLTLQRAREVAKTGVEYIAIVELTHSAQALDLSLDLRDQQGVRSSSRM
jgi:nicotinate-nucleotide pyrophosphorylase (carboxylating)